MDVKYHHQEPDIVCVCVYIYGESLVYIYIYIYMCVCVCVCVCIYIKVKFSRYRPGVAQRVGRGIIALLFLDRDTRRG